MRPFRVAGWACALLLMGVGAGPAHAAWSNVFQVCCFGCRSRPAVSCYAPDPCCPAPAPVCTTRYVQRCYYQPVTCYQTKSYYEPVTTYRTSYYYEPVTSYRYSCYFDPCTCRYQQVACPTTCYRLRSQCCPVQSWVQRCCQVPVTTYRQSFYFEPVTTCCTPATCCPSPCPPNGNGAVVVAPAVPSVQTPAPPTVTEQRTPSAPTTTEPPKNGSYDRYYPTPQPPMPPAAGSSYRQVPPRIPAPPRPAPPLPPPTVKLDRIVAIPGDNATVRGLVISNDNTPRAGAQLMFVGANRQGPQQSVRADTAGQFRLTLASGGWLVYVHGTDGKPVFHSKIEVQENESRQMTLVSR